MLREEDPVVQMIHTAWIGAHEKVLADRSQDLAVRIINVLAKAMER